MLGLKLLLAAALLRDGFVSVSGDDFWRALIAFEWAKQPFFISTQFDAASSLWLPLQFWLNGIVMRAVPEPWLVPIGVNVALACGGLLYLFAITRRLMDAEAGILAVLLVGILPWHIWLSISGMAEIGLLFFLTAAFYYFVRWEAERATRWALIAGIAVLAACMVRPEGWLYAAAFTLRLAWVAARRARWSLLIAAGLPWTFVGAWLVFNYVAYGDALQFVRLSRQSFRSEAGRFDSLAVRLFQFPFLLMVVSTTLSILTIPSLVWVWRRGSHLVRRYATLSVLGFALLVVTGLLGLGTTSSPQRYVVVPLALVTPLVAVWCRGVLWPALGTRLAVVCVMGYVLVNAFGAFQFVREFDDEVRVARVLTAMRVAGLLEPNDLIATDRALATTTPAERLTPEHKARFLVDRWALQVLSGMPDAFVDRDWALDGPASPIDLRARNVRVIAVESDSLADAVPSGFTAAGRVGSYRLYTADISREKIPSTPVLRPTTTLPAQFAGLRFEGYREDAWATPRVVRLFFVSTETDGSANGAAVQVRILEDGHPAAVRAYTVGDYVPIGPRSPSIEIPIRFHEEFDLPPGRYSLGVTMLNAAPRAPSDSSSSRSGDDFVLGPFNLIVSKRDVIKRMLNASHVNRQVLAWTLLTF